MSGVYAHDGYFFFFLVSSALEVVGWGNVAEMNMTVTGVKKRCSTFGGQLHQGIVHLEGIDLSTDTGARTTCSNRGNGDIFRRGPCCGGDSAHGNTQTSCCSQDMRSLRQI